MRVNINIKNLLINTKRAEYKKNKIESFYSHKFASNTIILYLKIFLFYSTDFLFVQYRFINNSFIHRQFNGSINGHCAVKF